MPIFRVKSVKIYTGQKKFTRTPSVASVTNMRYELKVLQERRRKRRKVHLLLPKYTTVNALVSTAGMIAFVFIRDLLIPHSSAAALCSKASSPISALPAPIVLGAPGYRYQRAGPPFVRRAHHQQWVRS